MSSRPPARLAVVTGTDTGVGKTRIACALLAAWRARGHAVAPFKPVETGCAPDPETGRLVGEDALRLASAAGNVHSPERVGPIRYPLPAAPAVAAAAAGRPIDRPAIDAALRALAADADLVLVEGAGGLAVPWTATATFADYVQELGAPILIVARTALGTLNHTLLTLEAARSRGLRVAAVILNQLRPDAGPEESASAAILRDFGRVAVLGPLPYRPEPVDLPALAELAREHLDPESLFERL